MPNRPIERLYLDFDSFFASAEQHFNPALRGRPVGVVPLDTKYTGCIAVSCEAKALGVKSGATIRDARARVPDMIFVVARHDVYVRLHQRILDVVNQHVPVAHVRSIDEVVCHLKADEAARCAAPAADIKAALAREFSTALTCSIGTAPTELLAKIAAELDKPNGYVELKAENVQETLRALPLMKIPGISKGIDKRLRAAGVSDVASLWSLSAKHARSLWGSVEGERFWREFHGFHAPKPAKVKRMFGHSRMLPRDWRELDKIRDCARQLTLSAARRMRRTDLRASKFTLSFRGGGFRSHTESRPDTHRWSWEDRCKPSLDDRTFLLSLDKGLKSWRTTGDFAPRSVSVMLHGLITPDAHMDDLFSSTIDPITHKSEAQQRAKWERVSGTLDLLRREHGPKAVSLGSATTVPGGYLGGKIAFGRIPDAADFTADPVDDEATHFCSF